MPGNVDLQTFLATLPPQQREAVSKLPENQQISIMNESLNKSNDQKISDPLFNYETENETGLKLEKSTPELQPEEKPLSEPKQLQKDGQPEQKYTQYVIQNNTGLNHYAKIQGQARQNTDSEYTEVDLKREIGVIQQNNPDKNLKNLRAGETLVLEGEIDTSNMDSVEDTLNKYLKGQNFLAKQEKIRKEEEKKEFERQQKLTGEALKQSVVTNMKESYDTAKKLFDKQMKKDGWAGDVADGISVLWNNGWWNATGNRAKYIRQDLETYKNNTAALDKAYKEGNYNQKFKEIYGVEYNEKNVKNFNEKEAKLKEVSTALAINDSLDKKFGGLIKKNYENFGQYKDHEEVLHGPTGTFIRKTPAKFLLTNAENGLNEIIGKENMNLIGQKVGVDLNTASDKEKYEFYIKFINNMVDSAKNDVKDKLNGRKADDYLKDFENASNQAFGTNNKIQERVIKYIGSQEVGAATVKGVAKSAIVAGSALIITASGGTATPLVMAGLTTGASIGVEVSDKASNDIDGDLNRETMNQIVKNGVIEGVAAYGGAHLAKGITGLKHFNGKYTQKAWTMASDGASGAVEGTASDLVKGGIDNVSKKTVAARALISSTLGNVKVFTNNRAVLNGFKLTKSGVTSATLQEIKLEIKKQSEKDVKIKEIYEWIESNPQEFEKLVSTEIGDK